MRKNPLSFFFFFVGLGIILFVAGTLFNLLFKTLFLNTDNFYKVMQDETVLRSIWLTMYTSFLATIIAMIFGIPLAYVLARHDFPFKQVIESFIDIPIIIPHTVAGIALFSLLMKRGAIGGFFESIGIVFQDSMWGVVAAMLFVSYPFFVNAAKDGFASVNPNYENVARTLGASQTHAFLHITLPLSLRHVISGAIMSWARGVSEFGAVVVIAYYPMIASTLILYRFNTGGLSESQPIAVLLIIMCFITFMALRLVSKKKW
ncbi:MAG TPA: ABC transporter permease [Candidatus Methanofastidiosa archaeon]|nr:ABC transporter permease [Candidatus Methanofastidiosa archaeon]